MNKTMLSNGKIKVAVVQLECKLNRNSGNMKRAERYIEQASAEGAQLICLPEAFLTSGNILEVADIAVPIPGACTDRLCELAKAGQAYIAAGLLEKDGEAHYSTSVLISPRGELACVYRRVHCFSLEKKYIRTGGGFSVADTPLGRVGLLQGYDINFPEACRELYRRQVDIIVCSALIPEQFTYITKRLLLARAIETQCYLVFASGVGANPYAGFSYMGRSEILADPLFLEQESFDFVDGDERLLVLERDETCAAVELDVGRLHKYRASRSLLSDLEPGTYWRDIADPGLANQAGR